MKTIRLAFWAFWFVLRNGRVPEVRVEVERIVEVPVRVEVERIVERIVEVPAVQLPSLNGHDSTGSDRYQVYWVTTTGMRRLRYVGGSAVRAGECFEEGRYRREIVAAVLTDGAAATSDDPDGVVASFGMVEEEHG